MKLNREAIIKLQETNRYDLIVIYYINESGYAGLMPNGSIVDRRFFPEATPIKENPLFGIEQQKPLPKKYSTFYIKDTNGHGFFVSKDKDFTEKLFDAQPYRSRIEAEITIEGYSLEDCNVIEIVH